MTATVKTEYDPKTCLRCKRERDAHGYARHREGNEGVCNNFEPTPLQVDYHPPAGDRGEDPARFSTTVRREVYNARHQLVQVHVYHEAEMRQLDKCGRTGLSRMQLVMPDLDRETGDWRDCDGDRSYTRRYLLFNPSSLYVEGGAWIHVDGFTYERAKPEEEYDGMSSYDSYGPNHTTLTRIEKWRQYVPRDAISWGDEEE